MKAVKLIFIFMLFISSELYSSEIRGDVVIFPLYSGRAVDDSTLKNIETSLMEIFYGTGRLMPVEYERKIRAIRSAGGKNSFELYRNSAEKLGAERFILLKVSVNPLGRSFLEIDSFFSSGEVYKREFKKTVYTYNLENLPLKASLFYLDKLKDLPVNCKVTGETGDDVLVMNRGQWNGIVPGEYMTARGTVKVLETGRYTSYIENKKLKVGDSFTISILPETREFEKRLKRELLENDIEKFGIDRELKKRNGPIKESLTGTCIVNPGSNVCLPVYGSYLSTEYLGLKKTEEHWPGLFIAAGILGTQLLAVPAMTDFESNFFPWIKDSDKSTDEQRLQIFLWSTIPFTYTAAYFDQLSYQFERKGMLPPQFINHDVVASFLSTIVPGGGHFYKGYRFGGWMFYVTEMSLLSYSIYNLDSDEGKYALGGFAFVKAVDIVSAALLKPSYRAYKREYGRGDASFNMSVSQDHEMDPVYQARVSLSL